MIAIISMTLALLASPFTDTPDQLIFPPNYGSFTITSWEHDTVHVTYEGGVEFGDADDLRRLMEELGDIDVHITINSGGGMAYEGLALYWEAERWDNLTTIAGKEFGAWSAAALFWLGSPIDLVEEGGFVGFHEAFCDPYNPPGCDTDEFSMLMTKIFVHEFGLDFGVALAIDLIVIQKVFGVQQWIGIFSYPDGTQGWGTWTTSIRPYPAASPWSP